MSTLVSTKPPVTLHLNNEYKFVTQSLGTDEPKKKVRVKVNHIVWIDCSGSMSSDLRHIRKHLKNKLPSLVHEGDTITLGYFSGRGQYGILQEEVEIASLTDLTQVNNAIDRFLQPICLTGFKEPLLETQVVIDRIQKNRPDSVFSFIFLSDGYDNQWSSSQILEECQKLSASVVNAVVVEYGYYCNHQLLLDMAASLGGTHVFSESFQNYEPVIEQSLSGGIESSAKVEVSLDNPLFGIAFSLSESGTITSYQVQEDNTILVGNGVEAIHYLSKDASVGGLNIYDEATHKGVEAMLKPLYAMLDVLVQRHKSDAAYTVLRYLGDTKYIRQYTNAYGKQNLYAFSEELKRVVGGEAAPLSEGYDPKLVPAEDQYCVLNLFMDLISDKEARWFPQSKDFVYNRIGSKQVFADKVLTATEQKELQEKMSNLGTDVDHLTELQQSIDSIMSGKVKLKTERVYDEEGYLLSDLVWNEKRPNLSVRVSYLLDITLPKNEYKIPQKFRSSETRTYTFIKDGVVNVDVLPVRLGPDLYAKLVLEGIILNPSPLFDPSTVYLIDLTSIPVINRKMVNTEFSADDTFRKAVHIMELQAKAKVFKAAFADGGQIKSASFVDKYGQEGTEWLKKLGVSPRGFNPPTVTEKSGDVYTAVVMEIKIAGASSLPSIAAVQKKVDGGKNLNTADRAMVAAMDLVKDFKQSTLFVEAENPTELLNTWLESELETAQTQLRKLQNEMARIKFAILLGQVWFSEFESEEDSKMEFKVEEDVKIKVSASTRSLEVKI